MAIAGFVSDMILHAWAFGLALSMLLGPALAEPKLEWRVKNNFPILGNDANQLRFKTETTTYLECMKREFNPLGCPSSARPGLTTQPYFLRFKAKSLTYREALLWPSANERVKDRVTIRAQIADAPENAKCKWVLNGEPLLDGPCEVETLRVRLFDDTTVEGRQQVNSVSVTMTAGGQEQVLTGEIRVRRIVVVAMGDSFMAGEGNPHTFGVTGPDGDTESAKEVWLEKRCHRSLLSAAGLAALRLAASGKDYVVFVNVACSGATTWHVPKTTRGYEGVESAQALRNEDASQHYTWAYMPAQIDEVRKAFCGTVTPCTVRPDHLFLSIGINDLEFNKVVTRLVANNSGMPPQSMTVAAAGQLARLGKDRATTGSLLHTYFAIQTELAPRNAYVVEYPDPTKDDRGEYCNTSPVFSGLPALKVDAVENQWADDTLLKPLNAHIGRAVDTIRTTNSNWRMATGVIAATANNGYCADKSHFNMGQDSKVSSGTLHPNVVGHDTIAELLYGLMIGRETSGP